MDLRLLKASDAENIQEVKELISAGADIDTQQSGNGWSPLHIASNSNNMEIASVLIDAGANINLPDKKGWSPLHIAAFYNHVKMALILINAGANTSISDKDGKSPHQLTYTLEMRDIFIEVEKNKEMFSHAMQEGWVDINIVKLAIMGPPAVGKTSFLHLLFNWPAPKRHHSTPIGNRPIRAIQRVAGRDDDNIWSIVGIPDLKQMMAEAARILSSSDQSNGNKVISASSHYQTLTSQTSTISLPLDADMYDDEDVRSKLIPDPSHFPKDILQSLAQCKQSAALYESTWIHVLDSGGQPQFADVSRAFIHGNVINIIVLKLTQNLADKPYFVYSIEGKQVSQPAVLQMTYIQLIQSFVRSIVSSKYAVSKRMKVENVKPLFFIVGTYHDHTHGVKGLFKSIEPLREKNSKLIHALREYREHLVFFNELNDELIFPVNNLCKWSRETISSEIRRRITGSSNSIVPIKIPIRWYMFEIKVKEESLIVAHGIVTLHNCEQIAIKLGMGKREVFKCIEYLNSLSLFLYFPILPHVVFTNPQYLLDMVTSLVRVSFVDYPQELLTKGVVLPPDMQRKLRREGMFTEELLHYLSLEFIPNLFTKSHLIELLQYLFIIAPVRKTAPFLYFLPSALPTHSLSVDEKMEFTKTCEPLLLLFENKVLPQGLFTALVVALMRRSTSPKFTLHESMQQLRYAVHLDSDDLDGTVGLIDSHYWLEIYYTGLPGTCCRNIFEAVCEVLPSCASVLCYDQSVTHVVPTLQCQNEHKKPIPPHPAKVSYADGKLIAKCTEEVMLPPIQLTDSRYVSWFKQNDSNYVDAGPIQLQERRSKFPPKQLLHDQSSFELPAQLKEYYRAWERLHFALSAEYSGEFAIALMREGIVERSAVQRLQRDHPSDEDIDVFLSSLENHFLAKPNDLDIVVDIMCTYSHLKPIALLIKDKDTTVHTPVPQAVVALHKVWYNLHHQLMEGGERGRFAQHLLIEEVVGRAVVRRLQRDNPTSGDIDAFLIAIENNLFASPNNIIKLIQVMYHFPTLVAYAQQIEKLKDNS